MKFRPGVLTGKEATDLLNYANENGFALPAVRSMTEHYMWPTGRGKRRNSRRWRNPAPFAGVIFIKMTQNW